MIRVGLARVEWVSGSSTRQTHTPEQKKKKDRKYHLP